MVNEQIEDYISRYSSPPSKVLQDLFRKTNLRTVYPRMLSGHIQGKFLEMISLLMRPERILEIGTFTAYGTISLARGLKKSGKLITLENNEEVQEMALAFIREAGYADRVELIIGDALETIPKLQGPFDLVFIDADKLHYPHYYTLVKDKIRPGSLILVDNVLWGGKVVDKRDDDPETQAIREFTQMVRDDKEVEQLILPVRDGLMMIRKNE